MSEPVKQSLQVSVSYAKDFSGQAGLDIGKKIEKAAQLGEYRFFAGGFGVGSLPELPKNKFDINDAVQALQKALGRIERDSSIATSYTCASYSELGVKLPAVLARNESRYKALAAQHLQLTGQRSQILQELERIAVNQATGFGDYPKLGTFLQNQLQQVESARSDISAALAKLREGTELPATDFQVERIGSIWDPLRDVNFRVADDLSDAKVRIVLSGRCALPFDNYHIKVTRITETGSGLDRDVVFNSNSKSDSLRYDESRTRFTGIVDVLRGGDGGIVENVRYYEVVFTGPNGVEVAYFKQSPTS